MAFKKPKKVFYNSPKTAQNLPHKRQKSCNYNALKEDDIIDNYEDYVRNLAIGYGVTSMPVKQTYEPANPHAIEADHCYTVDSPQDKLLEDLLLKNITVNTIQQIEENTRAQHSSAEWHEMRSCRITASNFYAASHCTSVGRNTLLQKILAPKPIYTRSMSHGKIHEPIAIQNYEAEYGLEVQKCGLFISKEFPFLAASPDGLLGDETVIEVKCPYSSRYSLVNEVTIPYLEKIDGDLQLKKGHPYYAQVQGQMYCTDRKYCNFIVYTFKETKVLFMSRDDSYINEMIASLVNFYNHHLEPAILNKYLYRDYLSLIKRS